MPRARRRHERRPARRRGRRAATSAAWLGAYWALRLRLDGAVDHAAGLIARDFASPTDTRSAVFRDIRSRVLDLYADLDPEDARWTLLLLSDPKSDVAERALYRVSRHAPRGMCDAVAGAAVTARPEAAEHALLALTTHGDVCRDAIGRLADNARAPREIRGTALEIVAALGDPDLAERIDRARKAGVWEPAIQRAWGCSASALARAQERVALHVAIDHASIARAIANSGRSRFRARSSAGRRRRSACRAPCCPVSGTSASRAPSRRA